VSATAPAVSICIRGWRATYLTESIASVLEQSYTDLELVVADDAGDLEPVVAGFDDPRVRYHRNPRRMGVSGNIRAAFSLARGRYLGLLGDDDRMLPGYVERTVAALEADPEAGLVFTSYLRDKGGVLLRNERRISAGRHDAFLPTLLRPDAPVPINATLMRREVWESGEHELPLPDDAAPDVFIFVRAALAGWPFVSIDEPLMAYRLHEGQTSADRRYLDRVIATWERFSFADPECEELRRGQLARARAARRRTRARSALQRLGRSG
jgi:glycosyltransferase involved in cell wall biosynthesis